MSFLKRLSNIFKPEDRKSGPVQVRQPQKVKMQKKPGVVVDLREKERILQEAQAQAKEIVLTAKEDAFRVKQDSLDRVSKLRNEAEELSKKIVREQTELEKREAVLGEKENILKGQMRGINEKISKLDKLKQELIEKLEKIAHMTRDEAKTKLMDATSKKLSDEIAIRIKEAEEEIKEKTDEKAREILTDAMRFGATDYVAEFTVSTVNIKGEEMKGRVIGKEGRNIRAFEKATGVDVDLDEENVIRLSSFDSVRREIAKLSLEQLLRDGRIQPARIEEVVLKTKTQVDKIMLQAGEDLCRRVKVYNLPIDLVKTLGRFKYRFSYGQNMILHTLEETKMAVSLAYELGANVNVVRLGCLLHDIGKVITDKEGSHVQLGVEYLKKYNIPSAIVDCVAQHHEDEDFSSTEAVLVYVADAISGSRPGARYEDYEEYVKRIKEIEDLAKSFKGVKETFAVQAGREIRVIVSPEELTDSQTVKLAHDLKEKIQQKLSYPGTIKVTAIREFRQTDIAK